MQRLLSKKNLKNRTLQLVLEMDLLLRATKVNSFMIGKVSLNNAKN